MAERKSPRLMLLMPPRHGKSELASIRFPAWHLGRHPTHEIINVSYNLDLPMRFSRRVREIFRDPAFEALFPTARLDPDAQGLEAWTTTLGGGFTAAGRGGGITGKGAHILIVDDPLKNQEEADSALTRESLWDWYLSTAYTRLAPGGGVLIIETWWNDDDLAGRVQQAAAADPDADQFEIIRYPALAEEYEFRHKTTMEMHRIPKRDEAADLMAVTARLSDGEWEQLRVPGEALHRERYDEIALRRIKAVQDPRIWSALYQQNPVPDEGMVFQKADLRFQHAIPDPYQGQLFTAWDFAISEKQTSDFTVGVTLFRDSSDTLYMVDMVRGRMGTYDIVEAMLDMYLKWGNKPGSQYVLGVEDGHIWKVLKPVLSTRMGERKLFPAIEELKAFTDKKVRASTLAGRVQQHRFVIPETAPWRRDTEMELLRFPGGAHDDIVDALSWAARLTQGRAVPGKAATKPLTSWRDRVVKKNNLDGSHLVA